MSFQMWFYLVHLITADIWDGSYGKYASFTAFYANTDDAVFSTMIFSTFWSEVEPRTTS